MIRSNEFVSNQYNDSRAEIATLTTKIKQMEQRIEVLNQENHLLHQINDNPLDRVLKLETI